MEPLQCTNAQKFNYASLKLTREVMQTKELDMVIIHMGMELNLHKTVCHFLVANYKT